MAVNKNDPAFIPDYVWTPDGLVPPTTPAAAEARRVEDARIARENAGYEQGCAASPNSNQSREAAGERARGRRR